MSESSPELTPAFALSQPTISHHLKVLHEARLLDREKRGVWVYYRARPEAMKRHGHAVRRTGCGGADRCSGA
jgi:DNA-binding transcriptional ArsR family regulator